MALVEVTEKNGVARIAFNRPELLNALNIELSMQTLAAVQQAVAGSAKAIVLTGNGRAFSAGADLAYFSDLLAQGDGHLSREVGEGMRVASNPLVSALSSSPIPVVCAVNGPCAGGSVGLALAADIVIAARSAYFLVPQVATLGVLPDLGATWQFPHKLGRARALGALLLGERVSAQQAQDWGLIWRCVDDAALEEEAMATAQRLIRAPAAAVSATRALVDAASANTLAAQLESERLQQMEFLASPFFKQAVRQFLSRAKEQGRK